MTRTSSQSWNFRNLSLALASRALCTDLAFNSMTFCFSFCFPTVIVAPRDCSDYSLLDVKKNGVYRVTPDPRNGTFEVLCDVESYGGGWTVIQQRLNGSVSFNRTWAEYKKGFGNLRYWALASLQPFAISMKQLDCGFCRQTIISKWILSLNPKMTFFFN